MLAKAQLALWLAVPAFVYGFPSVVQPQDKLPDWATDNTLQLNISADPTNYAVIPLTEQLSRRSDPDDTGYVDISGNLRVARKDNFYKFDQDPDDLAYFSCDEPSETSGTPKDEMLRQLMLQNPRAIVLFSTSSNWCSLDYYDDFGYSRFLSMVDTAEATTLLNHLNDTETGEDVSVSIFGNTTQVDFGSMGNRNGTNKPTIAMTILYVVTAIITLMFLGVVITGALKAHRNPERYGPRNAIRGRPGQSRAKGLARAVLETLPIVKFGDRQPPKPDPELEMETATTDGRDSIMQRGTTGDQGVDDLSRRDSRVSKTGAKAATTSVTELENEGDNLGCSICTDDFRVGEDVRVLPCNHQFHPACIDPWLINISGTCPLCRLDLRPSRGSKRHSTTTEGEASLPPPLAGELGDNEATHSSNRTRLSRRFDVNRIRQASVEEQIEVLRRLREERVLEDASLENRPENSNTAAPEDRNQGANFAAKLKEKFRILTKSQAAHRQTE